MSIKSLIGWIMIGLGVWLIYTLINFNARIKALEGRINNLSIQSHTPNTYRSEYIIDLKPEVYINTNNQIMVKMTPGKQN